MTFGVIVLIINHYQWHNSSTLSSFVVIVTFSLFFSNLLMTPPLDQDPDRTPIQLILFHKITPPLLRFPLGRKKLLGLNQPSFLLFQLHITATGYESCDGDREFQNSTDNNFTSTSSLRRHSTSNSTIFDGLESTICSDDFASSFPDVSIFSDFHMVNSVTCMNVGTSLEKAIKRC